MTHAQRNAAIVERISAYTAVSTASRKAAQTALIAEGFYLNTTEVAPEFSNEEKREPARA